MADRPAHPGVHGSVLTLIVGAIGLTMAAAQIGWIEPVLCATFGAVSCSAAYRIRDVLTNRPTTASEETRTDG